MTTPKSDPLQPGTCSLVAAALTFAVTVPIGAASGADPDTVLYRAIVSSAALAAVTSVLAGGWRLVRDPDPDD